jgi:phospholipid/cholesterol/gamma-HCH transport system ATP-binding protein
LVSGNNESIIDARGIVNRFGRQTVHEGLALQVKAGEVLGIAGGSGSGKSVLLKTLVGLHRPAQGDVRLDGRPVGELQPAEKASLLGVLFQQGALFSSLTVAQNVMLPLRLHHRLRQVDQERIAALKLALTGLPADAGAKLPAQLSGGMVKRAALARALALDPPLLFLDEPTSDLDPASASGIDELILQLNRSLGLTIVLVSHDLITLLSVCHRIAMLVDRALVTGTAAELQGHQHPAVREFLQGPRARAALAARDTPEPHGSR